MRRHVVVAINSGSVRAVEERRWPEWLAYMYYGRPVCKR
jgi:hypothetical protein